VSELSNVAPSRLSAIIVGFLDGLIFAALAVPAPQARTPHPVRVLRGTGLAPGTHLQGDPGCSRPKRVAPGRRRSTPPSSVAVDQQAATRPLRQDGWDSPGGTHRIAQPQTGWPRWDGQQDTRQATGVGVTRSPGAE
jgi:hypothetical protein